MIVVANACELKRGFASDRQALFASPDSVLAKTPIERCAHFRPGGTAAGRSARHTPRGVSAPILTPLVLKGASTAKAAPTKI